jgi:hypothetical protein
LTPGISNSPRKGRKDKTMKKWYPAKNIQPKPYCVVLIVTDYFKMATAYYEDGVWYDAMRPSHSYGGVTHWQKLPALPSGAKYEWNKLR